MVLILQSVLILDFFGFLPFSSFTLCDWLKKTRATYSANQMQNRSRLGHMRFPALGAGYVYLSRALIGSLFFTAVVIGCRDLFALHFTTREWKPLLLSDVSFDYYFKILFCCKVVASRSSDGRDGMGLSQKATTRIHAKYTGTR